MDKTVFKKVLLSVFLVILREYTIALEMFIYDHLDKPAQAYLKELRVYLNIFINQLLLMLWLLPTG